MSMMKAAVFVERGRIELADKPIPDVGPNDALIRITTTTICGTDIHILKGEYPVAKGLTIGHEPVGVIEKLGSSVTGYKEGQRVIAGAICPNFNSYAAQDGVASQDGSYLIGSGRCGAHGYKATAGWRFGNLIDGTQAEYVLVPDAQGNLAPIPDGLSDEQVLMCPDIMSTGFKGAENAHIRIGDVVAVFAQGPIGLCATAGARLQGASTIIVIDGNDHRLGIAKQMGADVTLNFHTYDVVDHWRPRRRCVYRSARYPGHLRICVTCAETRRHAVQPRRLFERLDHSAGHLCRRAGRPQDQHRTVPRRQGAHASIDEHRSLGSR